MTKSEFGELLAKAMIEMGAGKTMNCMAGFMLCVVDDHQSEGHILKESITIQTSMGSVTLTTHQAERNMENKTRTNH